MTEGIPQIPQLTMEQAAKGIRLYCEAVNRDPVLMAALNLRMMEIEAKEKRRRELRLVVFLVCLAVISVFFVINSY